MPENPEEPKVAAKRPRFSGKNVKLEPGEEVVYVCAQCGPGLLKNQGKGTLLLAAAGGDVCPRCTRKVFGDGVKVYPAPEEAR